VLEELNHTRNHWYENLQQIFINSQN